MAKWYLRTLWIRQNFFEKTAKDQQAFAPGCREWGVFGATKVIAKHPRNRPDIGHYSSDRNGGYPAVQEP